MPCVPLALVALLDSPLLEQVRVIQGTQVQPWKFEILSGCQNVNPDWLIALKNQPQPQQPTINGSSNSTSKPSHETNPIRL